MFWTRLIAWVGAVRYESRVVDGGIMSSEWFARLTGEGCALGSWDPCPYWAVRDVGVCTRIGGHSGTLTEV